MGKIKYSTEDVQSIFKANPAFDKIFITADANHFPPTKQGEAHCKNYCKQSKISYETLTRAEFEASKTERAAEKAAKDQAVPNAAPSTTADPAKNKEKAAAKPKADKTPATSETGKPAAAADEK